MAGLNNSGGGGAGAIRAGRAYVEAYLNDNQIIRGLDRLKARFQTIGRTFQTVGVNLARTGVFGAVPLAASLSVFKDFDDAIRQVGAVSNATAEEFASLTEHAKALGRTSGFTATEVAKLMTELSRAGFNPGEVEQMTQAVVNLARATGTDAALSAEILTNTLRQFNLEADQTTRVADALAAAANKSNASVEGLGETLSYAGTDLAKLGLQVEDALALAGVLANVGIKGSNAGTALRRLGVILAAEGDKIQEVFGVASKTATGNLRPIVDVVAEIFQASKDLPTAVQAEKFNEVFGLLSITSASALGKSAGAVRELRKELGNAGGEAARTAAFMDAGIGGAWRRFRGAVEGTAIAIGDALAPALIEAGVWLNRVLGAVVNFVTANKQTIVIIGAVTAGLVVGGAALAAFGLAASGTAAAAGLVLATLKLLGAAVLFVTSPVGILAAALAALAYTLTTETDSGRSFAAGLKSGFLEAAETAKSAFAGIADAIRGGDLQLAFEIAATALKLEWQKVIAFWTDSWNQFKGVFVDGWHAAVASVALLLNDFRAGVTDIFLSIAGVITPALATAAEGALAIIEKVLRAADALDPTDSLKDAIDRISGLRADAGGIAAGASGTADAERASVEQERAAIEKELMQAHSAEQKAREDARAAEANAARDEIARLQKQLDDLKARAGGVVNRPGGAAGLGGLLAGAGGAILGGVLSGLASAPRMRQIADTTRGAFDTSFASRRFGGRSLEKDIADNTANTAEAAKLTAMNTDELLKLMRFR